MGKLRKAFSKAASKAGKDIKSAAFKKIAKEANFTDEEKATLKNTSSKQLFKEAKGAAGRKLIDLGREHRAAGVDLLKGAAAKGVTAGLGVVAGGAAGALVASGNPEFAPLASAGIMSLNPAIQGVVDRKIDKLDKKVGRSYEGRIEHVFNTDEGTENLDAMEKMVDKRLGDSGWQHAGYQVGGVEEEV